VRRLVYLTAARRDLVDILEFITRESASLAVGVSFTDKLRQQCRKLAALPGTLGRRRTELGPDIRSHAFRGYVIFFRYTDDQLQVVNILEGHRDVMAHFRDSGDA
jgi:toxin ParE1/3/4